MAKRLPRDLSGRDLVGLLRPFGYEVSRTTGSHMRLTTAQHGEFHVTIPAHDPLRLGTLAGILDAIAQHHGLTRDELVGRMWH